MKRTITGAVAALAFAGAALAQPTQPEDPIIVPPNEPPFAGTNYALCGGAVGGLVATTGSVFNPGLGVVVWVICSAAADSGFFDPFVMRTQ